MSGSFQVKAKRKHESGCKGTVRASFRSRAVKWEVAEGMLDRRLYPRGVNHWMNWKNRLIYEVEVLNQTVSTRTLMHGKDGSVAG